MQIPSLQAISALETLDRLGTVKETAEELNLTQSAVSHKLKTLQDNLGFPVTVSQGRGVVLTSQARQYIHTIRPALLALKEAHRTIETAKGPLTVSSAPGFAAYWLAPHIADFRHFFPDITVNIFTSLDAKADVRIEFTQLSETSSPLMRLHFFPVCAPHFSIENPLPKRPSDLDPTTLFHLNNGSDWDAWLAQENTQLDTTKGVRFDDVQTMLAATTAGQGISLGDRLTCENALRTGALVRPYSSEVASDKAYVLTQVQDVPSASAIAFESWLKDRLKP